MLQWFCSSFALAPGSPLFLLSSTLFGRLFALSIFTGFSGLLFPDCAGALITADGLRVSHRMKPLAAFFVGALTAR
ncbi:hypothetical protein ECDEC6B_2554 [Escherichia coli DEC6B]|nr:hypothetical protein ECDEC6B_2554 [Escherichia coli DEC6B]